MGVVPDSKVAKDTFLKCSGTLLSHNAPVPSSSIGHESNRGRVLKNMYIESGV